MTTADWIRPVLHPRTRVMFPIIAGVLCVAAFTVGMTVGREPPSRILIPVVAPVSIAVPPAPPAQVVVAPSPPAPMPEPPPPLPPPPQPRATRPELAAHCFVMAEDQAPDPTCAWDDGFPAISADGSLIATKYIPDDGGRGYFGISIRFLDARTGRIVREAVILSPDEYTPPEIPDKLRMTVLERAVAVQRKLDAGKFRTLIALGEHDLNHEQSSHDEQSRTDRTKIHAEFAGSAVRVIDPSTNTEIGRRYFGVASPHPTDDSTDMCAGWGMIRLAVWWDPATRTLLGVGVYRTGGCMCHVHTVDQVFRLP